MASTLVRVGQRSCNQLTLGNDQARDPDVFDKIRSLDLLPRFPREVEPAGRDIAGRAKPTVYGGVEVSALSTPRAQSAAGGDGYELNFENTPIATLAKAASNWIARLDNADTMRTGVHVYRVKFVAEELRTKLRGTIGASAPIEPARTLR